MKKNGNSGFSLVEVLIAIGLIGGVALAGMTISLFQIKSVQRSNDSLSLRAFLNRITLMISSDKLCTAALKGTGTVPVFSIALPITSTDVKLYNGDGSVFIEANSIFGDLKILSVKVTIDRNAYTRPMGVMNPDTIYFASLEISVINAQERDQSLKINKVIPITVRVKTVGSLFISCSAMRWSETALGEGDPKSYMEKIGNRVVSVNYVEALYSNDGVQIVRKKAACAGGGQVPFSTDIQGFPHECRIVPSMPQPLCDWNNINDAITFRATDGTKLVPGCGMGQGSVQYKAHNMDVK